MGSGTESSKRVKSTRELKDELAKAKEKAGTVPTWMPASKIYIDCRFQEIDPSLVDVSPENKRQQNLLDDVAVADMLPSFRSAGQTTPALLRPKDDGRFELIDGSRRLYCALRCKVELKALVGDIPDADISQLSDVSNESKPLSIYEEAVYLQSLIDSGKYSSWSKLGEALEMNSRMWSSRKALVELDVRLVMAFPDPNSIPARFAQEVRKLGDSDAAQKAMLDKAAELHSLKMQCGDEGRSYMEAEEVSSALRDAARAAVAPPKLPSKKKAVTLTSEDKTIVLRHSRSRDGAKVKFEFSGISDKQEAEIIEALKKVAQV